MPERVGLQHLPNGARLVAAPVARARSIHLGAWLRCGARYEAAERNGLSHFLEHMVFKAPLRRQARTLARDLEVLGGQFDAYTTHEATCYRMQILPDHLDQGLDLLAELIVGGTIQPGAVQTEKNVVIEEILEAEESPPDVVTELAMRQAWGEHPLARPVLGTVDTVDTFTPELVTDHRTSYYTSDRLLLAAVGAVTDESLAAAAAGAFAELPVDGAADEPDEAVFQPGPTSRRFGIDQVHLCLAAPAVSVVDPDRYAVWLLDALLGATMSSRLFQEVREERGLCYQISSSWQGQRDVGTFLIEAVAQVKQIPELLRVITAQVQAVIADGVSEEDLAWVKEYSRTTAILGDESLGSRLSRIARGFFYGEGHRTLEQTLAAIEAATADDIARAAARVFGAGELVLATVGPVTARREERWWKVVNDG